MPERRERHFAGKVHAFNAGYARVRDLKYEVIGSLDGDISFDDQDFFSSLLRKLAEDPTLGLVGTPFKDGRKLRLQLPLRWHRARVRRLSTVSARVLRRHRRICAGEGRRRGSDCGNHREDEGLEDEDIYAHMVSASSGNGNGPWYLMGAPFRTGVKDYTLGNHPIWELFRTVYQMTQRPFVIGGMALACGYVWALIRGAERVVSPEMQAFRRREDMQRLRRVFTAKGKSGLAAFLSKGPATSAPPL